MSDLLESISAAQALASDLEQRLDRLIALRSAPDGQALGDLEQLADEVAAMKERVAASLAVTTSDVPEASDTLAAALDESQSQLEDAAEAVVAGTSELAEEIENTTQDFREALADDVTRRLEEARDEAIEQLERLRERAERAWSDASRRAASHIASVTGDCTERFTRDAQAALQASERTLERIGQLKEEIERSAQSVAKAFELFADAMRTTQTGLNLTAGTLQDIVGVFSDVA
jgi:DNA anti-recombination protein RmuC